MIGDGSRAQTNIAELPSRRTKSVGLKVGIVGEDGPQVIVHVVILPELTITIHFGLTTIQQELAIKRGRICKFKVAVSVERNPLDFRDHRSLILERMVVVRQAFGQ